MVYHRAVVAVVGSTDCTDKLTRVKLRVASTFTRTYRALAPYGSEVWPRLLTAYAKGSPRFCSRLSLLCSPGFSHFVRPLFRISLNCELQTLAQLDQKDSLANTGSRDRMLNSRDCVQNVAFPENRKDSTKIHQTRGKT